MTQWHKSKTTQKIKYEWIFFDYAYWGDVSWLKASHDKSWDPDNAVTVRKLNIHEMLTPCHFDVNLHQIEVILGVYMFSRSRNSFLTSIFKFDEVFIKYSWIIGHDLIENKRDGGKTVIKLSNQVRLT